MAIESAVIIFDFTEGHLVSKINGSFSNILLLAGTGRGGVGTLSLSSLESMQTN